MVKITVKEIKVGDRIKFCRRWWQVVSKQPAKTGGRDVPGQLLLVLRNNETSIRQVFDENALVLSESATDTVKTDAIDREKAQAWLEKAKQTLDHWQARHVALNTTKRKLGGKK